MIKTFLQAVLILAGLICVPAVLIYAVVYMVIAPPAPPAITQQVVDRLVSVDQTKLSAVVQADRFCIVGKGGDVYVFANKTFPDFKLNGAEDKLFLRSDTHWHLVLVADETRTYQILPIDVDDLDLANQWSISTCARDFWLDLKNTTRFGRKVRVFDAAPIE
jgi:hypothetical protein